MIGSPRNAAGGLAGDVAVAGAKSAPPVAASTAVLLGQTLEPWVVILTVAFLALQIAFIGIKILDRLRGNAARD
jgi:hypothetical protein